MLADDMIWGARDIAAYTGVEPRRIYSWAEKRSAGSPAPPIHSEGKSLYARKSEMNIYFSANRE